MGKTACHLANRLHAKIHQLFAAAGGTMCKDDQLDVKITASTQTCELAVVV